MRSDAVGLVRILHASGRILIHRNSFGREDAAGPGRADPDGFAGIWILWQVVSVKQRGRVRIHQYAGGNIL
jgi:hypothetical protein